MKTTDQTSQSKSLRKTNDRWKWMAGATAATAASAMAAHAQTTITLGGLINSAGVDTLSSDVYKGREPLEGVGRTYTSFFHYRHHSVTLTAGTGKVAVGRYGSDNINQAFIFGSHGFTARTAVGNLATVRGSIIATVVGDPAVDGGAATQGILTLTASASSTAASVTEDSFTFEAVPEPSNLALLALGATGLAALRARRKAA